jgi:hypothetical protein
MRPAPEFVGPCFERAAAEAPRQSGRGRDGLAFMQRYTSIQAKTLGRVDEAQTAVLEGGVSLQGVFPAVMGGAATGCLPTA